MSSKLPSSQLDSVDSELVEDGRVGCDLGSNLRGRLGFEGDVGTLLLVIDGSFDLALSFQCGDDVLVLPSNLMREPAEDAKLAVRLKSEDAKSGGNDVPLPLVVRGRNSLVGAVTLHRVLAASQLVRQHTADGAVKDSRGGPVMERASFGVDQTPLAKIIHVFELVAIKASRNVDSLAPNDDDALALKESLGDDGGETAEQMTAAVDDQRLGGETHLAYSDVIYAKNIIPLTI